MKEVNVPSCSHENDLISYLYGELNEAESQTFQLHMNQCEVCTRELESLQSVRESVIGWRNQCLGVVTADAKAVQVIHATERRSALAAIREFFNLSPLWLKGAVAFASLLFCALAGLAIARLGTSPAPSIATTQPNPAAPSAEQIDDLVRQRVQQELLRLRNTSEASGTAVAVKDDSRPRFKNRMANTNQPLNARRPLTKNEREQLAADLRLVSARNESEFDLIDDGINQ